MPNGVVLPLAPALLYMHLDVLLRFFLFVTVIAPQIDSASHCF